jgi:peptidoglycan/xylan/chitin deacetylase (PgdA/CDA1 family)
MYHSISENCMTKFKPYTVLPAMFAEQMAYLAHNHYTPITTTQLIRARLQNDFVLPERPVVITFDDGFADFFSDALPALKQYDFTATIYISTAYMDGTSRWLDYVGEENRPMLTWNQVSEINANGIECGAHTHTHPKLDEIPVSLAKDEIETSKKLLEDHLGQEVLSFAYPHGSYTYRVQQIVQDLGFHSACAVKYAMSPTNDNPFALARLLIPAGMGIEAFAALLIEQNEPPAIAYARKIYTLPHYISRSYSAAVKRRLHVSN